MKAIRTIIALLFLAVSAGTLLAVRSFGPAIAQNWLRIAQIISKGTSANPNESKREVRRWQYDKLP
jgi:hypothetical protein